MRNTVFWMATIQACRTDMVCSAVLDNHLGEPVPIKVQITSISQIPSFNHILGGHFKGL